MITCDILPDLAGRCYFTGIAQQTNNETMQRWHDSAPCSPVAGQLERRQCLFDLCRPPGAEELGHGSQRPDCRAVRCNFLCVVSYDSQMDALLDNLSSYDQQLSFSVPMCRHQRAGHDIFRDPAHRAAAPGCASQHARRRHIFRRRPLLQGRDSCRCSCLSPNFSQSVSLSQGTP